jgi:hypothetical protein
LTEAQSWFLSLLFNLFSLPLSFVLQTTGDVFPVDKESITNLQTYSDAPFQRLPYNEFDFYHHLHMFVFSSASYNQERFLETETLSRYCSVPFWKLCTLRIAIYRTAALSTDVAYFYVC